MKNGYATFGDGPGYAYSEQLVACTVIEQLLYRVVNHYLSPVPPALRARIEDANLDHTAAHARVHLVGSAEVVQRVDRLATNLTTAMQASFADHLDETRQAMVRVRDDRNRQLRQMRSELG